MSAGWSNPNNVIFSPWSANFYLWNPAEKHVFYLPERDFYRGTPLETQLTYHKPRPPLVTVAPSDKQTELLTVLQWQLQCENLVPWCFCTILDTEGHQMGIKYSMEGFTKYLKINTVGNSKREFTDHNESVEYLGTFRSVLFGFKKCNKINYIAHPLRIPGISVTSTPGTSFFHFWRINPIKPMRASDLPMFLYGAEN